MLGILPQQPHGFHIPDGLPECFGGKAIFGGFILGIAEAGFLGRQLGQLRSGSGKAPGNILYNGIQLLLGHFCQLLLGFLGLGRKSPGLLSGRQVFIEFHWFTSL